MGTFDGLPKAARLEILTRVPTQTVLYCKLVSKSWRQIVRDPSFAGKHLKHLSDSDSGKVMGFILFHKTPGLEEYAEYDDENDTTPFSKARRFNIISPFEHYEILDSCNGLLCFTALRSGYYPFLARKPLADRLKCYGPSFICNPVTREIVVLPEFEGEDLLAGFGYCSLTNEYKVVGIRSCKREANYGDVQVYTLGSGKGWRNAGKMEYKMEGYIRKVVRRGVLANDALHWVDAGGTLLTFDLASEKLSVISSPPMNEPGEFYHLVVLGDYLYDVYMHNKKGVWLLKQTNANRGRPWKKKFSLGLRAPFASTKSGRFLCLGQVSGSVYRSDPKTSSSELLESFSRSVCIIIPHRNTLISLKELGEENTQSMESVERERSIQEMQTAFVSITRADITSFFIEFFRNVRGFIFEETEPDSDSDSVEEKHDSDSVEDKPDPVFLEKEHNNEAMFVDRDENEIATLVVGDEDEDEDSDTEGPWYRDRGDVKCIGDILVGFITEKIKYSLINQASRQAAGSYVGKELTNRHDRRKLVLGTLEKKKAEAADEAIVEILVKDHVFGPRDRSMVEAANRTTLETLVKGIVDKIAEKVRPIIIHEYIESKKKRWIEQCGTHNVDKLIEFSQFHKYPFYINVCGFYEKEVGKAGFGVIIREFRGYPLAAFSEYICDDGSQVSSFYHELQGVNKGLELAIGLNLKYFRIFTTQTDIGFLVMSCQTYENQCHCDPKGLKSVEKRCERCVRRCVYFCQDVEMDETEVEKIYLLLIQVMDQLRRLVRSNVSVMCRSSFNTRSASYLAKREENKGEIDIKSGDLQRHPELREILFSEASGEHGSNAFSLSLF